MRAMNYNKILTNIRTTSAIRLITIERISKKIQEKYMQRKYQKLTFAKTYQQ